MTDFPTAVRAQRPRKIGLALGSGSARGWAHIGVLRALAECGIHPDVICGTSIGALVGAAYAADELDPLESWVREMGVGDVLRLVDVSLSTGLVKGKRLVRYLRENFSDRPIETLNLPFAAVATDLATGMEVWIQEGSTVDAVRASIALPGIFTPVFHDGRWLTDGGLVNPVPVSLARAMGAEIVIAVDLNTDLLGRHLQGSMDDGRIPDQGMQEGETPEGEGSEAEKPGLIQRLPSLQSLQSGLARLLPSRKEEDGQAEQKMPSLFAVLASSLNIMQVRITRSRMAGDPADIFITPRLAHLSLYDFHRSVEAIEEGRRAVTAALPQFEPFGLSVSRH